MRGWMSTVSTDSLVERGPFPSHPASQLLFLLSSSTREERTLNSLWLAPPLPAAILCLYPPLHITIPKVPTDSKKVWGPYHRSHLPKQLFSPGQLISTWLIILSHLQAPAPPFSLASAAITYSSRRSMA